MDQENNILNRYKNNNRINIYLNLKILITYKNNNSNRNIDIKLYKEADGRQ
jgi:hypothetical protein